MKKRQATILMSAGLLILSVYESMIGISSAAIVRQLDFTSGAVNWTGQQGRILDRLLDQDGQIIMGQYQPLGEIVDSITKGHKTYSLFTSGMTGAPAPSATINGNSITVDLSPLFLGWQRGDQIRAWNIGGQATGLFNPQTSEFSFSWDHLFNNGNHHHDGKHERMNEGMKDHAATFFLQGKAVLGGAAPIAIPATLYLYATGVLGLGSWTWWRRRRQLPTELSMANIP